MIEVVKKYSEKFYSNLFKNLTKTFKFGGINYCHLVRIFKTIPPHPSLPPSPRKTLAFKCMEKVEKILFILNAQKVNFFSWCGTSLTP